MSKHGPIDRYNQEEDPLKADSAFEDSDFLSKIEQDRPPALFEPPTIISSGGLGPCCAIFVREPNSGRTVAAHFAGASFVPTVVDRVLELAADKLGDLSKLELTVGGIAQIEFPVSDLFDHNDDPKILAAIDFSAPETHGWQADRATVEQRLRDYRAKDGSVVSIDRIKYFWTEGKFTAHFYLDTKTGTVERILSDPPELD